MNNPQSFLSSLRLKKKKKKKKKSSSLFGSNSSFSRDSRDSPPRSTLQKKRVDNSSSTMVMKPPPPRPKPPPRKFKVLDENIYPVKETFNISSAHNGGVTSFDFDLKGSIIVSGGTDYCVKYWQFHSSPYPMKPLKEPLDEVGSPIMGNHAINEIKWSKTNDCFFVAANYARLKVFDRKCKFLAESILGDMYLLDKRYTKGHTGSIYDCCWHPQFHHSFLTSSLDGTVRLWNAESCHMKNHKVLKVLGHNKRYSACTCCCWSASDGKLFAGMGRNGTMYIWDNTTTDSSSPQPIHKIENAHETNTHTSRMSWSTDGHTIITRGGDGDDTLKIWDFRRHESPLKIINRLPNRHQQTDCKFSPDEKYILTCSSQTDRIGGRFLCMEKSSLEMCGQVEISDASVSRVTWQEELNQIFLGCSDGEIRVLFDTEMSQKGVIFPLAKKGKKVHIEQMQDAGEIYNPHALRMYQKRADRGYIWAKNRKNPRKSHRPTPPKRGGQQGVGGELGHSHTEKVLREMGIGVDKSFLHEDPREALWRVAKEVEENPRFIDNAYKETQPKKLLRDVKIVDSKKRKRNDEESGNQFDEEEDVRSRFSKRRKTD